MHKLALLGMIPMDLNLVPALNLLESMSDEQVKAAIAAGVTMNDPEALKEFLEPQKRPVPAKS